MRDLSNTDDHPSLETIKASDAYPHQETKLLQPDGSLTVVPSLRTVFPLLPGEFLRIFCDRKSLTIYLTNFRVFIVFKLEETLESGHEFVNISLKSIDAVECRELFFLYLLIKDGKTIKIAFDCNEDCLLWFKQLTSATVNQAARYENLFAFAFTAWCNDEQLVEQVGLKSDECEFIANFYVGLEGSRKETESEFMRLGFNGDHWRIAELNREYKFCKTYPQHFIVPRRVEDAQLEDSANHRSNRRIPVVAWRHRNGALLLRSSQPHASIFGWRSEGDEKLLEATVSAFQATKPRRNAAGVANGHLPNGSGVPATATATTTMINGALRPMLILDARSYSAAWANKAKGGGYESGENYPHCDVEFMGLPNIHAIRKSFQQLRQLVAYNSPESLKGWLTALDGTSWLQYLSLLLESATRVCHVITIEKRPVLVHCSDGWDRTTQIVSLAKLLLDPHYRTIKGFAELVEREWIEFGHQFNSRFGVLCDDPNERSPIFHQWLDAVFQLTRQFPTAFEFNQAFLVKLAQHTVAGVFGTFLFNSPAERAQFGANHRTYSVWAYLHPHNMQFRNLSNKPVLGMLNPQYQCRDLHLWAELYCPPSLNRSAIRPRSTSFTSEESAEKSLTRAHSLGQLTPMKGNADEEDASVGLSHQRTGSDSNLTNLSLTPIDAASKVDADSLVVMNELVNSVVANSSPAEDSEPTSSLTPTSNLANGNFDVTDGPIEEHHGQTLDEDRLEIGAEASTISYPSMVESSRTYKGESMPGCDIATSTSDISDSRVRSAFFWNVNRSCVAPLGTMSTIRDCFNESKPLASSTRQNSCDERLFSKEFENRLLNELDSDGLTKVADPVQDQLLVIDARNQHRMSRLEIEVFNLRRMLLNQTNNNSSNGINTGVGNRYRKTSDEVHSDHHHPGSLGSNGTDISWEDVDERDTRPTRWIPDHAVTKCMGCDLEFWAIRRKHHCRSCGKIFCNSCTSFECAVPNEQLYQPVRVCHACFTDLQCRSGNFSSYLVTNGQ